MNFVKNSCRIREEALAVRLWELVEQANKKATLLNQGETTKSHNPQAELQVANKKRRWAGFEKEAELFLQARGGASQQLPWADLTEQLCERYAEVAKAGMVKKRKLDHTLGDYVLANIPSKFLNGHDEMARLPAAPK